MQSRLRHRLAIAAAALALLALAGCGGQIQIQPVVGSPNYGPGQWLNDGSRHGVGYGGSGSRA
jgi:hypothetical protein